MSDGSSPAGNLAMACLGATAGAAVASVLFNFDAVAWVLAHGFGKPFPWISEPPFFAEMAMRTFCGWLAGCFVGAAQPHGPRVAFWCAVFVGFFASASCITAPIRVRE